MVAGFAPKADAAYEFIRRGSSIRETSGPSPWPFPRAPFSRFSEHALPSMDTTRVGREVGEWGGVGAVRREG